MDSDRRNCKWIVYVLSDEVGVSGVVSEKSEMIDKNVGINEDYHDSCLSFLAASSSSFFCLASVFGQLSPAQAP